MSIYFFLFLADYFRIIDGSFFKVSSPAFSANGILPDLYNCNSDYGGVNPPFQWSNVPTGTQSFALLMSNFQVDHGVQVSAGDDWGIYVRLIIIKSQNIL